MNVYSSADIFSAVSTHISLAETVVKTVESPRLSACIRIVQCPDSHP
jgi:hypothetical protein